MKLKLLLTITLILLAQGLFAKGIMEERNASAQKIDVELDFAALEEQVDALIVARDYAAAIPLLLRMHELNPQELWVVDYLGVLYINIPEESPEFKNALFWLLEAEKRYSTDSNVYYNLACIYSLKSDLENTIRAMNKAVVFGWPNFKLMGQDEDLENFHTTSWWQDIKDHLQIHEQLVMFAEFKSIEQEKNNDEKINFYSSMITALNELAPHIPALQYNPSYSLGLIFYNQENYVNAAECFLEQKTIYEHVLGKEHPSYATSLNNLGTLYYYMEDYTRSEQYYLESLAISEQALGKEHPSYVESLNNLGKLFDKTGDYSRAEQYYLEYKAIEERE